MVCCISEIECFKKKIYVCTKSKITLNNNNVITTKKISIEYNQV